MTCDDIWTLIFVLLLSIVAQCTYSININVKSLRSFKSGFLKYARVITRLIRHQVRIVFKAFVSIYRHTDTDND